MSRCVVTGGAGFIGGHLARKLAADGHDVLVIDDLTHSNGARIPLSTEFRQFDTRRVESTDFKGADVVFHLAAVSRTPPAVADPERCISVNVMGTARVLEAARQAGVSRFVFSSSNVVYAADTAYRASKLTGEGLCAVYSSMYDLSTISLRYSNVYGSGMMTGDVAVFASLRDSKLQNGYIEITGDGRQSRDFTHVSDIVRANILAWRSDVQGSLDVCTGINRTMNEVAPLFECEVRHVGDRKGDAKHIVQNPVPALERIGWKAEVPFETGFPSIWSAIHVSGGSLAA